MKKENFKSHSLSLLLFVLLFRSIAFGQTTLLVDFGANASENNFGLSGWNTLIKSSNVSYSAEGPGGLIPNAGVEEYDDYEGVTGTSRNFTLGERIVVTWYNTSSSETYVIAARISFEDTDEPDADGSEGKWYTMRSFEDYRQTYQEIPPGGTVKTVFNITDSGVHATTGEHSVVNVNLHCEWFETAPKPYILCDKIELYNDADIQAPNEPDGLTANEITDSKIHLSWNVPDDNVGVAEYLVYNGDKVEGYTRTNSYDVVFLNASTSYSFTVTALDYCGNESEHSAAITATTLGFQGGDSLIDPAGFVYRGAIRLPETFSYGGEALAYNPDGDGGQSGGGAGDGYPGSLFISNLNNNENGLVGEVSIPVPVISASHNPDDLNEVAVLQTPVNIRPSNINNWDYVDIWRNGLEYVQSEQRLYNSWTIHYTVNEEKRATISCCDATDLSGSVKYGAWYVGNAGQPPLESATSDYIFELPQTWADANLGGRSMITGRFRDGGLSGLGPTLYAFNKVGASPPAADAELDITTLLEYGSVEGTDDYNFPHSINDYNHADAWRVADWIESGSRKAVMILGNKAHGDNWYGYQGENMRLTWIIADCPQPEFEETDPDGKGWRAHDYLPIAIFYNPSDLAQVAAGTMETYEPQPYSALRFDESLFWGEKSELCSAGYDQLNKKLYVAEYNAPNDGWILVYVFDYDESLVPVELNLFTASVNNGKVILNWETATEINYAKFEIERKSLLQGNWETLGAVQGHGNSNSPKKYSFTDKNPPAGKIQYRLKQIDMDGSFEYSDIVEVEIAPPSKFELLQNYPNPFNPTTNITYVIASEATQLRLGRTTEFSANTNNLTDCHVNSNKLEFTRNDGAIPVTLKVYDALGREVATLVNKKQMPGKYSVQFNAASAFGGLPSGVYLYVLRAGNFVQTRKMILIK